MSEAALTTNSSGSKVRCSDFAWPGSSGHRREALVGEPPESRRPGGSLRSFPAARRAWIIRILEGAERGLVLGLYGWLVVRMVAAYLAEGSVANLTLLPSEGLVVAFMLIRRTTRDISVRPADWLLAFGATAAALLADPGIGRALVPPAAGAILMLMGLLVQVHAKLVLGRSFGCVAANRGLKLAGPYRFVRHPMYAGYLLTHVAFFLMNPTGWNLAVYGICYGLQVPRLLAEERLLRRDTCYASYMAAVRYRLIPGVF
jgi:protein-S-isoprenylcysteine O-methyltransferase Ste14